MMMTINPIQTLHGLLHISARFADAALRFLIEGAAIDARMTLFKGACASP
jgi:hypothetical protein